MLSTWPIGILVNSLRIDELNYLVCRYIKLHIHVNEIKWGKTTNRLIRTVAVMNQLTHATFHRLNCFQICSKTTKQKQDYVFFFANWRFVMGAINETGYAKPSRAASPPLAFLMHPCFPNLCLVGSSFLYRFVLYLGHPTTKIYF